MARLEISLLGSPRIQLGGESIENLPAKAQALLIYLAVTKQQYAREHLAELLWSDENMPVAAKLSNLRGSGALLALNRQLGEFLEVHRHSLAFKTESDFHLDVDTFEGCLRHPSPTVADLQTAVNLYQGDFATGLSLREAEGFFNWAMANRERLRRLGMNALYLLAVHYKQARQYSAGIDCVSRLLALEPYFEEAHREMMLLLALTDQASVACAHYEAYWDSLDAEGLEPEPETQSLYQQIVRGEVPPDRQVPSLPATPSPVPWAPPFQAPAPQRHFVGRQALVAALLHALHRPDDETIQALVGMGGVGKSSLAAAVAQAAQEDFSDGVLWANAAISEPAAVLESWAQAYGYDFSRITDLESMANAFRSVLAERRVLLVLDDVVSVSRIRPLLPNGPGCRVLMTTRDQDMAYALNARVWRLTELAPADGRHLLGLILGEGRVETEPEAAAEICDLLQNLPLAVEIIGQRLKSRPRRKLADIVRRLRDEKRRLSELKISDRAVRASFALSYASLDEGLKEVFALMGVFNGRSFTAQGLSAIAGQDRYEAEDRIFALVALSLAREEEDVRYIQHPLLADFAREKLAQTEDEAGVYGRFARHYLQFAREHQYDYDALRPEWDNMMAAMEAAYDFHLWPTVIEFTDALHPAWFTRARFTEARRGYQWGVAAAEAIKDDLLLARSQYGGGRAAYEQGDYEVAQQWLRSCLANFQNLSDRKGEANAHFILANIAMNQSDYDAAVESLRVSRQIFDAIGDQGGLALVLEGQARLLHRRWQYEKAHDLILQALRLREIGSDRLGLVTTLRLLVDVELALHHEQPRSLAEIEETGLRALKLCRELNDEGELAATLYGLSRIKMAQEQLEPSQQFAAESEALFAHIGDKRSQAMLLHQIAFIAYRRNEYQQAIKTARISLDIFDSLRDRTEMAAIWFNIGYWHYCAGEPDEAVAAWQQAYDLAREIEHEKLMEKSERYLKQVSVNEHSESRSD